MNPSKNNNKRKREPDLPAQNKSIKMYFKQEATREMLQDISFSSQSSEESNYSQAIQGNKETQLISSQDLTLPGSQDFLFDLSDSEGDMTLVGAKNDEELRDEHPVQQHAVSTPKVKSSITITKRTPPRASLEEVLSPSRAVTEALSSDQLSMQQSSPQASDFRNEWPIVNLNSSTISSDNEEAEEKPSPPRVNVPDMQHYQQIDPGEGSNLFEFNPAPIQPRAKNKKSKIVCT